jgi:hypothetical protein
MTREVSIPTEPAGSCTMDDVNGDVESWDGVSLNFSKGFWKRNLTQNFDIIC